MYMYKTSILWSVWEGEHLGVSTFLTNYIKCTQGWIFYLFGFFFRTPSYGALGFWTCEITRFAEIEVTKPLSMLLERLLPPPAPSSGHSVGKAAPKKPGSLLKTVRPAWTWQLEQLGAFPAASRSRPTLRLPWSNPARHISAWIFKATVHI